MANTNITIRMDEELKKQAVREQRMLFIISRNVSNKETINALEEVIKRG